MKFRTLMTWSYVEDSDELTQYGAVEEIYGYNKSDFKKNKMLWYDVIYPDDRKYLDLVVDSLDLEINQERLVQYRITHKEGYSKNVLGSIKIEEENGQIVYSGYITDISTHNEMELGEDCYENLLELLNESLHTLYSGNENRKQRVCSLLENFSHLMSVGRLTIYKNVSDSIVNMQFKVKHKWVENKRKKNVLKDTSTEHLKFGEDFGRWQQLFVNKREPVNDIVRLLPESEKTVFEKEGVKSILAVPIWLDSKFYGFIQFDDFKSERYWSRDNIRVLSIIGSVIAKSEEYEKSKVMIREKDEQLKKIQDYREQLLKTLSHQIKTPVSIIELNIRMLEDFRNQIPVEKRKRYQGKIDRIHRAVKNSKEILEKMSKEGS